ncbi:MAG: TonB-dependent receptor [Opitutaceae bacterium]
MPCPFCMVPLATGVLSLVLIGALNGFAQEAPPASKSGADPAKSKGDTLVLSPFTVTTDADTGYLSKSTISGTGTDETLMKIPQTIQIANQELISDLASDDPMQAIEMVSGSTSRRSFNVGDDTFVWGFRVSSAMKDGVPYSTNATGTLYDVDRIEVIKGPAAMMFGQNSFTGGVINYVTRQPTKVAKYSIRASYGSYNDRSLVINASGPLTSKLRYRADLGATDSDYSERKFGQIKNRFAGGGMEYDLAAKTKLAMDFSYGTSDSVRPKTIIDPATRELIKMPDDYTFIQPWQRYPITQARGKATLTTALSEHVDSRSFVAYNNSTNDWLRDLPSSINPTARTLAENASHFDTSRHFVSFGQDFVVRAKTGPLDHKVLFGGDQRNDTQHNLTESFALSKPTLNYLNPAFDSVVTTTRIGAINDNNISSRTSGAYFQEQLSFWNDRAKLLGGMRYNEFFQTSGQIAAFNGTATVSQGSKTIGRFGVILQGFPQDITIHYNRSQSFLYNGGVDYRDIPLKPSVGLNNEVGVKAMFFNGALALSATYFNIELDNVRVLFTQGPGDPSPGASGVKQDGKQTNKGVDLSVGMSKEFDSGIVNLIATYYAGNTLNEANTKPVSAVNNTYSFLATYGIRKGALKNFKLGSGYVFKGERTTPTASGFPPPTTVKLPAYNVTRVFASYTHGRYSYQLNVDNLFDKIYVQGAESVLWVQTDPGRVFKGTVTYRF